MTNMIKMAMLSTALEFAQANKRVQVEKSKIADIKTILSSLMMQGKPTPKMVILIEDLFLALSSAESISMTVLPETMKQAIVESLTDLKKEVAVELLEELKVSEFCFEVGDRTYHMVREAVSLNYGGAQ